MCQVHPVIGETNHHALAGGQCPRFTDVKLRPEDGACFRVPILKRPLQREKRVVWALGQAGHFLHWPAANRMTHLHPVALAKRFGGNQSIGHRPRLKDK